MAGGVLHPEDVSAADGARVLAFVNATTDIDTLAQTVGFSEGLTIGRAVASAILAARATDGALASLTALMAVTGVTLSRFTEIVTALSGARPARTGGQLRLTVGNETPWLGQSVTVTGQVLDADRRGVPGTPVTCFASAGELSAQVGMKRQTGSSVRLVTEPGGVIRFSYAPALAPPLAHGPRAALHAELKRLDRKAETPSSAAATLKSIAIRYRSQGGILLRTAIDAMFAAYPSEAQNANSVWPLMPVTLMAVTDGPEGGAELTTVATLYERNWLGGWLQVLRDLINSDTQLDDVLKNFDEAAAKGTDLSIEIFRTTQAFAGLELGTLGQKLRDQSAGSQVNRFLDRIAPNLKDTAILNTVRAAGASGAATQSGGFAVFDAIRKVQDIEGLGSKPGLDAGKFTAELNLFGTRLGNLEEVAVDQTTFDALKSQLSGAQSQLGQFDTRLKGIETDAATGTDLANLRTELFKGLADDLASSMKAVQENFNGAVARLNSEIESTLGTVTKDVGSLTQRLGKLEGFQVDEGAFKALQDQIVNAQTQLGHFRTQLNTVQADSVQKTDLTALEAILTQQLSKSFETSLTKVQSDLQKAIGGLQENFDSKIGTLRRDVSSQVATVQTDLTKRIDAKADAKALIDLGSDLQAIKTENQNLIIRVDGLTTEIRRDRFIGPIRPIGPIGPVG